MADRRVTVTASETIHVRRAPEAVFNYVQDYTTRGDWDPSLVGDQQATRRQVRARGA